MSIKKYEYSYPEIKKLGESIPGTGRFIAKELLKGKYTIGYVNQVMRGIRKNDDIIKAMKKVAELSKVHNY